MKKIISRLGSGLSLYAVLLLGGIMAWPVSVPAAVQKKFHKPFLYNIEVKRMMSFGGALYAFVGGCCLDDTLRIYRTDHIGCKTWDDVTPVWSTEPGTYTLAVGVFNGNLYVGTNTGLYRSANGKTWNKIDIVVNGSVKQMTTYGDMIVYKGSLWVYGSGCYRYDGTQWHSFGGAPSSSFDPGKFGILNNQLYLGLGLNNANGIEIFRTDGVSPWTKFHKVSSGPGHVHAMHVFNGWLYIGKYHGDGVYRTNGSASGSYGHWEEISLPDGDVIDLEESNGKLYAAAYALFSDKNGLPLVYVTTNGTSWAAVPNLVGSSTLTKGAVSLADYNNRLYVGTRDLANGGEIFEVSDTLTYCVLANYINKSVLHYLYPWLWIKKDDLKFQKASSSGSSSDGWSNAIVASVTEALAGLTVPPDRLALKQQALDELQAVLGRTEQMAFFAQTSVGTADPNDRLPLLAQAQTYLENALYHFELFADLMGQIKGGVDPVKFNNGFDPATSPWTLSGAMEEKEYLQDMSLHAYGQGTAFADLPPISGNALLSFSTMIEAGSCRIRIGSRQDEIFSLALTPQKIKLLEVDDGLRYRLGLSRVTTPENRWRHLQIIKRQGLVQVYWDGRKIMGKRIGPGAVSFNPRIVCGEGTEAWFDDFVISQ